MAHGRRRMAAALVAVCAWAGTQGVLLAEKERAATPAQVGNGSVTAGRAHTVVALPDGRVFAWGAGDRGQLGDGANVDRWSPTEVPNLPQVVMVSAGRAHTLALGATGDVYAWGANGSGRLGDGTRLQRSRPVRVHRVQHVAQIAAGGAHSIALTREGRVFTWGRNEEGQLGTGSRTAAVEPVEVLGLPSIVAIAAGDMHSLAVAADGQVFAWGNNDGAQLGDGTSQDRRRPVAIGLANIASVAAGRAHSLALSRAGEVYAWGRGAQGQLGLGTTKPRQRPTLISGLQARAIEAGDNVSGAVLLDGHLAMWGANGAGQLGDHSRLRRVRPVMLAEPRSVASLALGAVHTAALLRDGQVLTWGEGQSGRLGFGSQLDSMVPTVVTSNIPGWGGTPSVDPPPPPPPPVPPASPSIIPAGGVFGAAQTVSLASASPSATIRFTLDGTVPTNASPVYTQPFLVETSTTVNAIAIGDGGLTSMVVVADFTIDPVPPTITALAAPSSADWLDQPVVVSFTCDDNLRVAACPSPVTVVADGVTEVQGVAVDSVGHQATTSVTVKIDRHSPDLAVDVQEGAAVDVALLNVTGTAVDAASGVVDVRCNGGPAGRSGAAVQCDVPLNPGRNDIIVQARDLVGHASSIAVTVQRLGTPSTMVLSPAIRTLGVDEETTLSLLDEFGAPVPDATWSTTDDRIVSLTSDPIPTLRGVAPGTTTVHVERNGLAADATIIVVAEYAAGDVLWSMPTSADYSAEPPIFAARVAADVPDVFAIETREWGRARVRAVRDDGEVLWQQESPGIPLFGDTFGGLVTGVLADVNAGSDYGALVRMGGGTIRPWRFDSAGAVGRPAQSAEGTMYMLEYLPGDPDGQGRTVVDKHLLVLDGATGAVVRRTKLARETDQFLSAHDGLVLATKPPIVCKSTRYESAPETQGPVVGADGRGYLLVRHYDITAWASCIPEGARRPDRAITMGVDLLIFDRGSAPTVVPIYSAECTATLGTTYPCDLPVRTFQIMPDGIGGTLVTWERGTQMVGRSVFVQRSLSRIDAEGTVVERAVGPQFWLELVGQNGRALTFDDQWKSMDVVTGDIAWSDPLPALAPLAARPDSGLAMLDMSTGELKFTNANGVIEDGQPFGLDWYAAHEGADWIGRRDGQLTAVRGTFSNATRWAALVGNSQAQQRPREPGFGIFGKTHLAAGDPVDLIRFRHVSIRVTPRHWLDWLLAGIVLPGRDEYGNRFFTIGAGSGDSDTSFLCSGTLVSDLNRAADYLRPSWDPVESLAYPPALEDSIIRSLIDADQRYADDLQYACRPEVNPGFYNSNSYAHGLLNAVGLPGPRLPDRAPMIVPGWRTPVPRSKFQ